MQDMQSEVLEDSHVNIANRICERPSLTAVHRPKMPSPALLDAYVLGAGMAYAQPVVPMAPPLVSQLDDHGAGTVGVVGGPLSQLLEQNYAILNQFKQNMEVYKVNENTELLVRFRDNILTVLNQMNAMQVKHPPLDSCASTNFTHGQIISTAMRVQ